MTNTPRYLTAQDRLERVLELAKQEFTKASAAANQGISYRATPERAIEQIGQTYTAAALADLLAILEPAEAVRWSNQATYFGSLIRTRTLGIRSEINALERDAHRARRMMRGMPY